MNKKSIESIDKSIDQLQKLKSVLKKKLSNAEWQIQQQRTKKAKLKHLMTIKEFFDYA